MTKVARKLVRIGITFGLLVVLLILLIVYTLPSPTDAARLLQVTGTPWAFLPNIRQDPTPTATVSPADVRVTFVENDYPGRHFDVHQEYVKLENVGGTAQLMDGWQIRDGNGDGIFQFSISRPGFILGPGAFVNVWTTFPPFGFPDETNIGWGRNLEVWDNGGDTAMLFNPQGQIVSTYSY